MAESKVHLKLLIDTKNERVLFAEGGKDFVDFIFHILAMPLATAIRLLGKQEMVGCLGKLYESVENLNDSYILQGKNKDIFLKPKAPNPITSVPLALLTDKPTQKIYYSCSPCNQAHRESFASGSFNGFTSGGIASGGGFSAFTRGSFNGNASGSYNGFNSNERQHSFSDDPNTPCSMCSKPMTRILTYVAPPPKKGVSNEGGFVKGVGTYMVTDDLVVKPSSTISSIALLNKFDVQELASLQEKEVDMGMNEALKLLKASLRSSNVLTTVFLNDNHDPTSVNIS